MIPIADRYWIGGTGNWSDVAHWSTTSGGIGGASSPWNSDNVYIDSATSQVITVPTGLYTFCRSLNCTGASNTTLDILVDDFYVTRDFTLGSGMSVTCGGLTSYGRIILGNTAGNTVDSSITTNGVSLSTRQVFIANPDYSYTLIDSLVCESIKVQSGTLNTNGESLICNTFYTGIGYADLPREIILGASSVTTNIWDSSGPLTYLTFNAGTSKVICNETFYGGGLTYNNAELTGVTTTISGSNIFNDLKFTAGKTVNLTAGTIQTVTSLTANGTDTDAITIQSTSAGSPATISKASGTVNVLYCSIKDITATGGAVFFAGVSTDVSGNTGWFFFKTTVKIGGAWKNSPAAWVKVGGVWKSVSKVYVKVGGAWKDQS